MASNCSFHSTQDELDAPAHGPSTGPADSPDAEDEEEDSGGGSGGSREEIRLLRQALQSVQVKLLETRKENRSLQAQLTPQKGRRREEDESVRAKGREEELMESLAELQAKLTDTQERYHQAVEEVEELRTQMASGGGGGTLEDHRCTSALEQQVTELKEQLSRSGSEQEEAARRVRHLEEALRTVEDGRWSVKETEQRAAQVEELYKEAQEEVRALQVGPVPEELGHRPQSCTQHSGWRDSPA